MSGEVAAYVRRVERALDEHERRLGDLERVHSPTLDLHDAFARLVVLERLAGVNLGRLGRAERHAQVVALHRAGFSDAAIGRALGVHRVTIQGDRRELGLPPAAADGVDVNGASLGRRALARQNGNGASAS